MTVAAALAKVAGAGAKLLGEFISSITNDFVEATGRLVRTDVAINLGYVRNWVAEAMDVLVEAQPHKTIGVTPSGMVEAIERMIKATAQLGLLLGTEASEELFMELIQEGFSNAVQTALGGAVQSMLNVYRGSAPPTPDELDIVIGKAVDMDSDTLALLIAMTGSNIPTTFYRVSRGFDLYVEKDTELIRQQLQETLAKLNEAITWVYELSRELSVRELEEALVTIKEAYSRGITLLDEVAERALSRLQELKVEIQTGKEWYDYSTLYPEQEIITEEDLNKTVIENTLEAEATYNSYLAIKSTIENTLATVDVDLANIVSKIEDVVALYVSHLNEIVKAGAVDYSELLSKIQEAMNKVIAYRNAVDTQTSLEKNVEVVGEQTTTYLASVYTLEVYSIY